MDRRQASGLDSATVNREPRQSFGRGGSSMFILSVSRFGSWRSVLDSLHLGSSLSFWLSGRVSSSELGVGLVFDLTLFFGR